MITLPTQQDSARFNGTYSISGKSYFIGFDWNDRDSSWYMSLYTPDGRQPICLNIKLVQGVPLFKHYYHLGAPAYPIYAIKRKAPQSDILLEDMGRDLEIVCFEEKDLL